MVNISSGTGSFSNGIAAMCPAYSVSKTSLNALTVMLAEETRETGVLVNAINPGLVRTRMRPTAEQSPQQAARDVLRAATLPDGGPSGVFFRRGTPSSAGSAARFLPVSVPVALPVRGPMPPLPSHLTHP